MLVIRMQRTGRKGHAQFRIVVQDSRRTPTSGKLVAHLGSYNPHGKQTVLDKEKAQFYLDHGAQPSDRATRLLKAEGVKLPAWVKLSSERQRTVRNADKRRSTRPPEPVEEAPVAEEPAQAPAEKPAPVPEAEAPEAVEEESGTAEAAAEEPTETDAEAVEEAVEVPTDEPASTETEPAAETDSGEESTESEATAE